MKSEKEFTDLLCLCISEEKVASDSNEDTGKLGRFHLRGDLTSIPKLNLETAAKIHRIISKKNERQSFTQNHKKKRVVKRDF